MTTTAPKPPTKKLLLAVGITTGITIGIWTIVIVGNFVFPGMHPDRLFVYVIGGLVSVITNGVLFARYAVQKHRRDAWWEGHGSCEGPSDEAETVRRIKSDLADLHKASAATVQRIEELTDAVFDLADAAARPRVSPPHKGSTYTSRATQDDTIPITRLDAHAEPESRIQLADRKQLDPEAEARAQGYAEGYVDGIARRHEAGGMTD
ncbi:hypothetical protein AB0J20_16165 [Micromonospora costi]|uniref:hypothetical protein n=1 Tax=Micromonospora costi TaxID=1530042 RepID=UPI003403455F